MAKLKSESITASDLTEYVDTQSDFAFELQVYHELNELGFKCEHGGTYHDPQTGKLRQFDIRAVWSDAPVRLSLAVECKNIQANFPLVVLRVPRKFDESLHHVLLAANPNQFILPRYEQEERSAVAANTGVISVLGKSSLYMPEHPVGKSFVQIGRDSTGLTGSDSEAFGKWAQAVSSAQDLVDRASREFDVVSAGWESRHGFTITVVVPVVVVPNGRLWEIDFSEDGNRLNEATPVDRCPYILNKACAFGGGDMAYKLSHLEFVTINGLKDLFKYITYEHTRRGHYATDDVKHLLGIPGQIGWDRGNVQ